MRAILFSLLAPSLAFFAAAHCVHEKLHGLPRGWTYQRDAHHDEPIVLHVALPDQNVDEFEQRLFEVSDPDHERYGQFMEGHEVEAFLQPLEASAIAVREWLKTHDITKTASDGEWISLQTIVGKANDMLNTTFAWFHNEHRGETELRTLEYSLPDHLSEHVDFLHPTVKFPSMEELRSTVHPSGMSQLDFENALSSLSAAREALGSSSQAIAPPDSVCNTTITPQCLLKLYNVHYSAKPTPGNRVSFASFLNQTARYTDLTLFETEVAPYTKGRNFSVTPIAGATDDQTSLNDATEANLDAQYVIGVSNLNAAEYITSGCGPLIPDAFEPAGSCSNEPYVKFVKGILALPNSQLPKTLSISYGEDEQTWPEKLAKKVCRGFGKLGARGVSVMFSSGDSGPGAYCENNNGTKLTYTPAFPASCPYVTTVGGTIHLAPERAVSFSGGGFSAYFPRPKYQDAVVSAYVKQNRNNEFSKYYQDEANGRAYPDVAAQGVNFAVINMGVPTPVSGTSASSPAFAGIVALLNAARLASGKPTLGFLNPFLYSKGYKALTDIVDGGSTGCSMGTMPISGAGFNATTGWDPATGLGTPNFGKLLALVAPGVKNTGGVL